MERKEVIGSVKENLQNIPRTAERALDSVQDYLGSEGMDYVKSGYDSVKTGVESGVDTVRSASKRAYSSTETFVRENPLYAVLGAAAVGVVIGALILRRPSVEYKA